MRRGGRPIKHDIKGSGLKSILAELRAAAVIMSSKNEGLIEDAELSKAGLKALIVKTPDKTYLNSAGEVISWDEAVKGDNSALNIPVEGRQPCFNNLHIRLYRCTKGVMLTHGNIAAIPSQYAQYLQLSETDRQMVVLPFF
jgi:acyl-CoA synthetase (AMP-forming)/AMP-acid ligase II